MWVWFSLSAALLAGVVVVLSKAGLKGVDSNLGFAIEAVCILIISWSVVAVKGGLSKIHLDRKTWIFLIIAGILTCFSSLCSFYALKLGQSSRTSSLERLSLVFSITLSIIFLKDKVNWQLIVGAIFMIGGAVLIAISSKPS